MAFAKRQACGRNPLAPVFALVSPTASSTISKAGDANNPGDDTANTPTPNSIITINIVDLQAIQ